MNFTDIQTQIKVSLTNTKEKWNQLTLAQKWIIIGSCASAAIAGGAYVADSYELVEVDGKLKRVKKKRGAAKFLNIPDNSINYRSGNRYYDQNDSDAYR